jgi:hypothetical protein
MGHAPPGRAMMEAAMTDNAPDLDPYLAQHVREALAQDPRVGELGVDVEIDEEAVVLRGGVTSAERQEAATEVARDLAPGRPVRNETTVDVFDEPPREEHLP